MSDAFQRISGLLYLGLLGNLLTVVAALPFVVALVAGDATTWPLLVISAPCLGPALAALFATMQAYGEGETSVMRTYGRAYRRHALRALIVGGVASAIVSVLAIDVAVLWTTRVALVAVPLLVVLMLLTVTVALHTLVAIPLQGAGVRVVARAALFLSLRRWPLTLLSLACLGVLGVIVVERPALGLGLALTPALYVVFTNCRAALWPVLPAPVAAPATV